jgi:hypothetical protein
VGVWGEVGEGVARRRPRATGGGCVCVCVRRGGMRIVLLFMHGCVHVYI